MEPAIERRIPLQGSYNFRDVGGYLTREGGSVRWQRLYRSDALAKLTEDDLAVLSPLRLATLIDLRSQQELDLSGPSQLLASHGTTHRHLPFLSSTRLPTEYRDMPPLADMYTGMLEQGTPTIRAVFELLASDTVYPAVVHCAGGKDRTGITIALVLRTLGVPDDVIAADYALTDGYVAAEIERQRAAGNGSQYDQYPAHVLRAQAETMAALLATIDERFGGTDQLLTDAGIPSATRGEIRHLLLEPAP